MQFKYICPFILLLPTLTGCSDNRTKLLRNISYFSRKNLTTENCYVDGSVETIENLIDCKLPFVVYLTSETCSTCKKFAPIMKTWTINEAHLVVKISSENAIEIDNHFNGLFKQHLSNREALLFPTVGIVKSNTEFNIVDNEKFMQTKSVFLRYMNKKYKTSDIYYTESNPYEFNDYYKVISYNNKNQTIKNLYEEKLLTKIISSNNKIVISNFEADRLLITEMEFNKEKESCNQILIENDTNLDSYSL